MRPPSDAQMIAAMLLRDAFDAGVALAPDCGDDIAATIGGGFFEAGRFGGDKLAEGGEHLRQAWFQLAEKIFGVIRLWHDADMLTMRRGEGNSARAASM